MHGWTVSGATDQVLHLLPLKHVLVELLLQPLIGQVDTQLLKAVLLEALKAVDVQDANGALRALPRTCGKRQSCLKRCILCGQIEDFSVLMPTYSLL